MTKPHTSRVTAQFESRDKAKQAVDDLIATGIPEEKIHLDEDKKELSVMEPAVEKVSSKIHEILDRHGAQNVKRDG